MDRETTTNCIACVYIKNDSSAQMLKRNMKNQKKNQIDLICWVVRYFVRSTACDKCPKMMLKMHPVFNI